MIDTDKYEDTDHPELVEFEGETLGDTLTNLLAEVKRLRKVLAETKGTIDEYIHDVWDGNLEGWQCASDNIAALGIKSEWREEE